MTETVYRSKVDDWLKSVFIGSTLVCVAACVPVLVYSSGLERILAVLAVAAVAALPWYLMATTDYRVNDYNLEVRSGPFHRSIPLRHITSVTPTRSAQSSPAMSLDRMLIRYAGGSTIMISPENQRAFLADLKARGVAAAGGEQRWQTF